MKEPIPNKLMWFFIAAVVVRLATTAISPVHELMHVILAIFQGQAVRSITWNSVWIDGLTPLTTNGAYFMELGFYMFLVLRFKPGRLVYWCFGVVHALFLRAPFSGDYQDSPNMSLLWVAVWIPCIIVGWTVLNAKRTDIETAPVETRSRMY